MLIKRKVYKFKYGFVGYECPNLYKKLTYTKYKPASLLQSKLDKLTGRLIKFIVLKASMWQKMVAYYKRYGIAFSYGFYVPSMNKIFIVLQNCGIKADTKCRLYKTVSTKDMKTLSEIVTHEFMHYLFNNYTNQVLTVVEKPFKQFYRTIWESVVTPDLLPYISRAHYLIAISCDKNIASPVYGRITQQQAKRFLTILATIKRDKPSMIKNKELFSIIMDAINMFLFTSEVPVIGKVEKLILKAYDETVGGQPYLQVGQELIYASEILAACANISSTGAYDLIRKISSKVVVH